MKKLLRCVLALCMIATIAGCSNKPADTNISDGVYTESAKGNNGDVKVEVEVKDAKVIRVEVVEHMETAGIADVPIQSIPEAIVEHQSLKIDTIAGATNTSKAILEAAELGLMAAGFDVEAMKNKEVIEAVKSEAEDVICDTVVIGAGGAGMTTAIELKKGGQNVILVEKQAMNGGATSLAATYFVAVNTEYQKQAGLGLSIDEYIADQVSKNPDMNADNWKTLLERSEESVEWLNSLGTKINRPLSTYQVATEDGSSLGVAIVKALNAEIERLDVDMRLSTKAVELVTENDQVKGVKVESQNETYTIYADNIVIATGGFASGKEALLEYAPEWADLPSTSAAGSTGDGFELVKAVDANLAFMDVVRLNPSVHSENGVNSSLSAARAEGGIMVNLEGKRFCNDYYPDYTTLSKWMMEQEGDHVYILIDQSAMDKSKRLQGFKDQGYFIEADTIEELAEKMGVPADNLTATIEKYQLAVKTGIDEEFGRSANLTIDFTQAPYYAVSTKPGLQVTLGGIEVDSSMHVVTKAGHAINNLYAVGECAHDGLFGGAPTNENVTFGKLVAEDILNK
ncbi:FAD-dependent oxidoreductase [Dielma fastidiosa]|uniref:Urocanate reductase n=1 Tax=Dielma fastidiosa TaxID=1034346 RepID=A0A318KGQ3_9FIRM|nr:FAD-dependent oxidoreductase [Dielma fastidiosa]PXX76899.1 fumarate reductase flavoprotein subunit [Dielma fastidiosa]